MVSSLEENRQIMVEQFGSVHGDALTRIIANSQRLSDNGGVGVGVVFILVPAANIAHLTPFEWPELITGVEPNENWEAFLKEQVAGGHTV
jgi:hypothetical protein